MILFLMYHFNLLIEQIIPFLTFYGPMNNPQPIKLPVYMFPL